MVERQRSVTFRSEPRAVFHGLGVYRKWLGRNSETVKLFSAQMAGSHAGEASHFNVLPSSFPLRGTAHGDKVHGCAQAHDPL